jgi:subtilisin family serine protease
VPPTQIQLPGVSPGGGPGGGGTVVQGPPLRATCNLPPAGVTSYENDRILLDIPGNVSAQVLDQIAARHGMTRLQTSFIRLTGRTLHVWRIDNGTPVAQMGRNICISEPLVAGLQPNYLFTLTQDQQEPVNSAQYAPQKLKLPEAHRLASGNKVLVAVIDSEVDANHPDLVGAVTASFEASADDERPHSHGTGMAGAIAAHRTMLGSAPRVGLLTVRAFSSTANSAQGTTFNILKGLDWAADQGARVVNMSFAGPSDPRLHDALLKAYKKGMVLIAAAGNAGPNSPPLFPGADPSVIAVTATDSRDALFAGANRGNYIAVAAPGVDVFAPAPEGTYQLTTGTSVAAAEVSGVAALLIERNPALTPAQVRKILVDTATRLGPKGRDRDFGAGLVNALDAVTAAKPK